MTLAELQQIAGTLISFQITIFTFRIARELTLDRKKRWFPIPDFLNLISVLINVIFLFIYPFKYSNTFDLNLCQKLFGYSILLFVSYPFVLLGHYDLFTSHKMRQSDQKYLTFQEKIVIVIVIILSLFYFIF